MATNPEKSISILQRASETTLDVWNCIVPRKTPLQLVSIAGQGFIDGATIAIIISIPITRDVTSAVMITGAASYLHYLGRQISGGWRQNRG